MFCYQCEQVSNGKACTKFGVCGKDPQVAALQDLLVHGLKGLSFYAHEVRKAGTVDTEVNQFTVKALFSTLTNVDFDPERFVPLIQKSVELREKMKANVPALVAAHDAATFKPESTVEGMVKQGEAVMESKTAVCPNADIQSLQDILLYGLKGVAAYADHAEILEEG